jgi:hypothetical protein
MFSFVPERTPSRAAMSALDHFSPKERFFGKTSLGNAHRLAALKATEAQAKVEREQLEARLRREEAKTSRQPGELV